MFAASGFAAFAGCGGGGPEALTLTPAPTPAPTLAPGEHRRWGHDPREATGKHDPPIPHRPLPDEYRIEKVAEGLTRPVQLAATPDGRIFVAEQGGTVRVIEDGRLLTEPFLSLDVYLRPTTGVVELGLTGIAVHPDFVRNPYVYVYHTADNPRRTVVARVRDQGGRAGPLQELLSWEAAPLCCHVGGGMRFAPDDALLIGVGDHEMPEEAQRPDSIPGSILRLNADGAPPLDNPRVDDLKFDPFVYSYGLRNPYDLAVDPATGRVFAGENGHVGQDAIVEVERGANYGWPGSGFDVPEEQIHPPLTFYHERAGIAGLEFYSDDVLDEFTGRLLFCFFHTSELIEVEFARDGAVAGQAVRAEGCHTDVLTGPDGFLYFLNYVEGALYRIAN